MKRTGEKVKKTNHNGLQAQINSLRDNVRKGQESIKREICNSRKARNDKFKFAQEDRDSIRRLVDECHKQALQHITSMYCIHEREAHTKVMPKLDERIKRLKESKG